MDRDRLQREMDDAAAQGVFPGGVLLAAIGPDIAEVVTTGRFTYDPNSSPVRPNTIYDLASLTKILSSTILIMMEIERGRLNLDMTLSRFRPEPVPPDKAGITLAHLLGHASGWPAWRPYYEILAETPAADRRVRMAELILAEPLEYGLGENTVYSDLNFILLGLVLEDLAGVRQDRLFRDRIAGPLDLQIKYRPLDEGSPTVEGIAPTEVSPGRGGLLQGRVHDDNAAAMNGVAGHAGLFGAAEDVWRIIQSLRASYRDEAGPRLVSTEIVRAFWRPASVPAASHRALGFDMPDPSNSSTGRYFSSRSVGHLGYTGTSAWYDPDRDLTVILLTNRVHPSADNTAIRAFRPRIHDAVVMGLDRHD